MVTPKQPGPGVANSSVIIGVSPACMYIISVTKLHPIKLIPS